MTPKEYSASEAKRLLEELAPYFVQLERNAVEEMIQIPYSDAESDRKRRCLAERIIVIRDLQSQLRAVILAGAQLQRPKYVA